MKKARVLISSVFVLSALAAGITAAGCHKHTYSGEYSSDNSTHWYAATCKHNGEKKDEEAHTLDADFTCTVCGWHHQHTYEGAWETNKDAHFRTDTCGHGTTESHPHVASAATNWTCTECNYVLTNSGIAITLPETEYVLPENQTTLDIPTTGMKVNIVKSNGMLADEVMDYSKKYYKGNVQISTLRGVGEGSYNIWATATLGGEETETFAIVYVIDELVGLELAEGLTTQAAGANIIAGTWKFNAKYKSGKTVPLTVADLELEGLDTSKITDAGKATVKYNTKNAKGVAVSAECTIDYTVTEATGPQIEYTKFSADSLTAGTITADKELIEGVVTVKATSADKQFVTVDANKKSYTDSANPANNREYTQRLKLEGAGDTTMRSVEIKTEGKTKIVVYAVSGSGSDNRTLVLAKSTFVSWKATPEEIIGEEQIAYASDKTATRMEFDVEEAGKYYLVSTSGGINICGIEIGVEVEGSGSTTGGSSIKSLEELPVGEYTTKTAFGNGLSIIPAPEGTEAGKGVAVEEKSQSYAAESKSFTKRIKLNGGGDTTKRNVEIVTTAKAKIVVYGLSGKGDQERDMTLSDGTNKVSKNVSGAEITKVEFEVEAGTFYLYCEAGNSYIYGIDVIYE